eukprot:TRINITY_DN8774_c0_g1_i1.p1 TRINITY_DN8774_c0_g1~~TRINITY_DN8774_c0_g1_i1.p1  ORF type:complete len:377 (-),score=59.76 TRINITY_DN8774_c0_g1_i1:182-1264(-)
MPAGMSPLHEEQAELISEPESDLQVQRWPVKRVALILAATLAVLGAAAFGAEQLWEASSRPISSHATLPPAELYDADVYAYHGIDSDSEASAVTTVKTTTAKPLPKVTLFCFSLMMPWGPERSLLEFAASQKQGIFGCDATEVWSSDVPPAMSPQVGGLNISVLKGINLYAPKERAWGWVANAQNFKVLWQVILDEGKWKDYDWTVKADPDTVLVADRLRGPLAYHQKASASIIYGDGAFLKNCVLGGGTMYGAAEIISKNGLKTYNEKSKICPPHSREDDFMNTCLQTVGVTPLLETHTFCMRGCDLSWGRPNGMVPGLCEIEYVLCKGDHSVWHAFKTPALWKRCLINLNAYNKSLER